MAIRKKNIGANQIDGARILLLNDEPIRAISSGQTPESLPLLKLDSNNNLQFYRLPKVDADPSSSNDLVRKSWVDTTFVPASALGSTVATLGTDGKIPSTQLPPIAVSDVYVVETIEARNLLTVQTGDVAVVTANGLSYIYNGTSWLELTAAGKVTSVAGRTGSVSLDTGDVAEKLGGPLYFTDSRAQAAVVINTPEGSYANSAIHAPSVAAVKTLLGDLDTDDIPEGSYYGRIYFSENRARTAAVIHNWAGSESTQAPSVSSIVSYVGTQVATETSRAVSVEQSLATAINNISNSVGVGSFLKADNNLGNLFEVAINTDLLPSAAGIRNIGSFDKPFAAMRGTEFVVQTGASVSKAQIKSGISVPSGTTNNDIGVQAIGTGNAALTTDSSDIANSTATGKVLIETGNKTDGTGNSGNIELRTGTSSGGTRGTISLTGGTISLSGSITANNNRITSLAAPSSASDAATKSYTDGLYNTEVNRATTAENSLSTRITNELNSRSAAITTVTNAINAETSRAQAAEALLLDLAGTRTMTGDLSMGSFKINNLADPTLAQSAATKAYVDYQIGLATGSGGTIVTDNVTEGSVNLFFRDSRAQAAAVVNSMAGSQTTQAPSVAAIKSFIVGGIVVDSMTGSQTGLAPSVNSIKDYIQNNVITQPGSALAWDAVNGRELDVQVDNVSVYVNSNQLAIKDSGVTGAKIAADAVTGANIRLGNNEALRARNYDNDGDVEVLKVDANDTIQFISLPRAPIAATPVVGQDLVPKSYIDNYFSALPQVTREVIPVTSQIIQNGYVDLLQQVNPSGLVVFTNSRVTLMPSVSGVAGDYSVTVVNGVSRVTFDQTMPVLDTNDVLYFMYFPLTGSGKGQESVQAQIETPTNKEYVLMLSAPRSMAIESFVAMTSQGTAVIDVTINGVPVVGMETLGVSSTKTTWTASSGNMVSAGDKVSVIVTDVDNVIDLTFSLNIS